MLWNSVPWIETGAPGSSEADRNDVYSAETENRKPCAHRRWPFRGASSRLCTNCNHEQNRFGEISSGPTELLRPAQRPAIGFGTRRPPARARRVNRKSAYSCRPLPRYRTPRRLMDTIMCCKKNKLRGEFMR